MIPTLERTAAALAAMAAHLIAPLPKSGAILAEPLRGDMAFTRHPDWPRFGAYEPVPIKVRGRRELTF